jgi:2-methylcitrate dehydratase PrpD
MGATQDVARFLATWPTEKVPVEMMHFGKRCLVNYFSVALLASRDSSVDILLEHFREEGGNARATIIGRGGLTTLGNAALANGYLGHLEDYDDTHIPLDYRDNIHPSSPILPAPMAAAEGIGAAGCEVLAAGVLGIEIALRLGLVIGGAPREGTQAWHITSTCGVIGAAAAAGRILRLTPEQMTCALGIAATQASGLGEVFGSMCKPFHAGRAAQGGLVAALLARRGFTSSERTLEGQRGFIPAMAEGFDLGLLVDELGERWEIPRVGLKPYACGAGNHALIDAMITLRQKDGLTLDNVARIVGRVRAPAYNLMRQRHPTTDLETKFSYYHTMAAAFVDGAAYPAQFTQAKAIDPVIASVRDRITLEADASLSGRNAVVTLELKDGRIYTERVDHPTGTPERPMSDDDISTKFRALHEGVLPPEQGEELLARLWDVERVADFGELMVLASGVTAAK